MSFWQAIQLVIQYGPEFWKLLVWIKDKVDKGIAQAEIKAALSQFDSAMDKALKTKDTTDLEDVFRGKHP